MSMKTLGIDLFRVDTVPQHELGLKVSDIRGGEGIISFKEVIDGTTQFRRFDPHGEYKYVKAVGANIAAGDAVTSDRTVGEISIPYHVIETAAEAVIEGIAVVAIASGSFGWIQTNGRHYEANVLDAVADDAFLESAAGGSLVVATNDVAYLQVTVHGCCVRKICDASVLGGATDKGVVEIRS